MNRFLANAKKKAQQKKEEEAQRRLEAERLQQEYIKQQQALRQKQQAEERRLVPVYSAIKTALLYCSDYSTVGYDRGYEPLKNLIDDNFIKTLTQQINSYSDKVCLSIGRFANTFHVTRDGRVGLDYSLYSNVSYFKFFYSSDLFEIKDNKLYFKHADMYYDLSKFTQDERELLTESLLVSQKDKLDVWSKPEGLEDALVTYQTNLKTLPNQSLVSDMSNDKDTNESQLAVNTPSFLNADNEEPGF